MQDSGQIVNIPEASPRNVLNETFPTGRGAPNPLDLAAVARWKRRRRIAWFIAAEIGAIAFVVGSVAAGISERFAADSLTPIFRVLPIVGATIVAILPIVFFGDPKRRSRWWRKQR
jgi:uncharacterized membrane protein YfcA